MLQERQCGQRWTKPHTRQSVLSTTSNLHWVCSTRASIDTRQAQARVLVKTRATPCRFRITRQSLALMRLSPVSIMSKMSYVGVRCLGQDPTIVSTLKRVAHVARTRETPSLQTPQAETTTKVTWCTSSKSPPWPQQTTSKRQGPS